jgi:hypothetical protein
MTQTIHLEAEEMKESDICCKKYVKEAKGALEEDTVSIVLRSMATDSPSSIMVGSMTSATTSSSSSDWPATSSSIDLPSVDE